MYELFYELIRVSIGTQECLSRVPTEQEWGELYELAEKQSLLGILFIGLQRLGADADEGFARIGMSELVYLNWMGMAAQIQNRNEVVSSAVGAARKHYEKEGFEMVLLKGQGNMYYYSDDLKMFRTAGDIDVWLMPKGFESMNLKERLKNDELVLKHFWGKDPGIRHCYLHIHEKLFDGIDVEVHFRPSFFNSAIRNRRFQKWIVDAAPEQFKNVVRVPAIDHVVAAVPTSSFNVIYQLNHMYRHIFDDGLGLRQILDYYFVLLSQSEDDCRIETLLDYLGLTRFCRALMYVMKVTFGLDDCYMIATPDIEGGEFLLKEIMLAGNFGKYDPRQKIPIKENAIERLARRLIRNIKFIRYYPEEVLSVPIFRIKQELWRIKMNILCK